MGVDRGAAEPRRTLLRGGIVWSGSSPAPHATWLALEDGRVRGAGDDGTPPPFDGATDDVEVIDLAGRHVLPAFTDPHTHLLVAAITPGGSSGSDWRRTQDALDAVGGAARHGPPHSWLVYLGVSHREWEEPRRPTVEELDEVSGDRPVLLADESIHEGVMNSAALRATGVGWLPDGHRDIDRGRGGRPTGLVWERAFGRAMVAAFRSLIDADDNARFRDELDRLARRCLEMGILHIHEGAVPTALVPHLEAWRERTPLRISWSVTPSAGWYDPPAGLDELADVTFGEGPPWLKLFADGGHRCAVRVPLAAGLRGTASVLRRSLEERSLLPLRAATERRTTLRGGDLVSSEELRYSDDQLTRLLGACAEAGIRPRIHAIGGVAAVQAARAAARVGLERWSLEHALLLADGDVPRIATGARVVSIQPRLLPDYTEAIREAGGEDALDVLPARSFLEAGVTLAMSSDDPKGPVDPLYELRILTTRRVDDGSVRAPDEVLTAEQAVTAATAGAAAAIGTDHPGALVPGAPADLAVLTGHPTAHDTRVGSTWSHGRRVAGA